jgi:hypothetical protein
MKMQIGDELHPRLITECGGLTHSLLQEKLEDTVAYLLKYLLLRPASRNQEEHDELVKYHESNERGAAQAAEARAFVSAVGAAAAKGNPLRIIITLESQE